VQRQALITILVGVIPVVLLLLDVVTPLAGVCLLVVFVGYTIVLWHTDQAAIKCMAEHDDDDEQPLSRDRHFRWKPLLLTGGGLLAMVIGDPGIMEGALRLAGIVGLDQGVIGATAVSLGTGAEMITLGDQRSTQAAI
jgi:cation:H+ antiporter